MVDTIKEALVILLEAAKETEPGVKEHLLNTAQVMALVGIAEQLEKMNEWSKKDFERKYKYV